MTDPCRILVTGSRDWTDREVVESILLLWVANYSSGRPVVIVHGACNHRGMLQGADRWADEYARKMGWQVEQHPADWDAPCRDTCRPEHRRKRGDDSDYCPAAGNYRNQDMVDRGAQFCLAFFQNPRSRGTRDCARRAAKAGIPTERFFAA